MSKWEYKFDIKDDWKKAENEEISAKQLSSIIVEKIKSSAFYSKNGEDLNDIIWDLEEIREHDDLDDLDGVWSDFYDWADRNRVWVVTC